MKKIDIHTLLGEKTTMLEEMINASPSCLKVIDSTGRLLHMNSRGLCLIEAKDFESVSGADVYSLVHEDHRDKFIEFNQKVCSGKSGTLIFEIVALEGTRRWMETYASPYPLGNGELAHIAITNDITEKVNFQKELDLRERLIQESSQLASLGKLAGGIAHEINNPLTIISGKAQQLKKRIKDKDIDPLFFQQNINKIESTINRISKIINGLKIFSREQAQIEWLPVSIDKLVQETLDLCTEKFKSTGVEIKLRLDKEISVSGCQIQLSQVLINLINNAFDELENCHNGWLEICAKKESETIFITITDSGPGIRKEVQKNLMTPFYTTKKIGKGTGLGLSISLGIVQSHGGKLYYNPHHRNTQFVIELPSTIEIKKAS